MCVNRSVYVAGFERGVRPIGFWSISITLSKTSIPSTPACAPGLTRARLSRFASALKTISFTRVDLPEPETPVTQMNLPTGNATSISFRLCCTAPLTRKVPRSSSRLSGTAIERLPARNCPVTDLPTRSTFVAGPSATTSPPCRPAPGPMSTSQFERRIISSSCSTTSTVLPMSRSRSGVSISLALSRWWGPVDGSSGVGGGPERGLAEGEGPAEGRGPDRGGEPQPLRFAARERRRRAVEREVADSDVVEEGEPLTDLLHDPMADQLLGGRQTELVEEGERPRDGQRREFVDRPVADRDREHLRLQPGALADGARAKRHVLLDPLARRRRVGLAVAALEARDDAVEREHVLTPPPHAVAVLDVDLLAVGAVEEPVLLRLGQLGPRLGGVDLVAVGDRLDHGLVEAGGAAHRPRHERTVVDRERWVGNEQVRVDLLLRAEAGAARAGAVRRVEGEDPRLELRQRDAVVGAGEVLGEDELLAALDQVDCHEPVGEPGRRLDRLREPQPQVGAHHEPVDDHLDIVLELLVELGHALFEDVLLAVDLDARKALPHQILEDLPVFALAAADDRRVDREPRALLELQHLVDDRVEALPRDRLAADRAMRPPDPRVEQAQVVVDLGHRAHRRARVARGRLLVDRDRRAEAVDVVDVRLLHHLEELPRVGRERLDVAALALGVDRVEGK